MLQMMKLMLLLLMLMLPLLLVLPLLVLMTMMMMAAAWDAKCPFVQNMAVGDKYVFGANDASDASDAGFVELSCFCCRC